MKKLMIAAASLMIAASVQASELTMVEVEMTPIVKEAKKPVDSRFDNYALENAASSGQ